MKLEKKRELAARALSVGKNRIVFNSSRLSEIKEAITKQDIKDLQLSGVIMIKEQKGRRKVERRKTRRRAGSIKKKIRGKKRDYMIITRKLRKHLSNSREKISKEDYEAIRSEIKASNFANLASFKERISQISGGQK